MKNLPTYEEYLITEKRWEREIKSSHLVSYEYDNKTQVLEIEFHNGAKYKYFDVPENIFKEFSLEKNILQKIGGGIAKAAKKLFGKDEVDEGTYGVRFWEKIRRGGFKYERID
jgi:hypothetical protein